MIEEFIQKYYDNKEGLNNNKNKLQKKFKFYVGLSASDELLGAKIIDIEYNEEENCPEVMIYLDNGSQIEIYMTKYKEIHINSD